MITLGIDTSNYATSLALYNAATGEVVARAKEFLPVQKGQLGLRQSDAVFHHTKALPNVLATLGNAEMLSEVEKVGVAVKPRGEEGSYMPCFLTGKAFAAAFAAAKGIPIVQTSHQQGHIMAALHGSGQNGLLNAPFLALHISGGTTDLLLVNGINSIENIGGSNDLYAGQAVDRLAELLGFPFPGGAHLSALAEGCGVPIAVKPSLKGLYCSFSGLENKCGGMLNGGAPKEEVAAYCLTYIGEACCALIINARKEYGQLPVLLAGGVMCSTVIKPLVNKKITNAFFAPPQFSSDNAIGNAVIAAQA